MEQLFILCFVYMLELNLGNLLTLGFHIYAMKIPMNHPNPLIEKYIIQIDTCFRLEQLSKFQIYFLKYIEPI